MENQSCFMFGRDENFDVASNNFEWTSKHQIVLLKNLIYLNPIGLNKHLKILMIRESVSKELKLNVSTKQIWDYVHSKWNIEAFDDMNSKMYPDKEDFDLSGNYDSLLNKVKEKVNKDLKKYHSNKSNTSTAYPSTASKGKKKKK